MKKEQAEKLVRFAEKLEVILDEASFVTDFFDDIEEKRTVRTALGGMIKSRMLLEELLLDQYPEFRDRLRPPSSDDW